MSGELSQSYEAPMCKCEHFKWVHGGDGHYECEGQNCNCSRYEEMDISKSQIFRDLELYLLRNKK